MAAIVDAHTVILNAPFSSAPAPGADAGPDGDLQSRDAAAECQHVRLLGPCDGGAESSVRRGGRPDDA